MKRCPAFLTQPNGIFLYVHKAQLPANSRNFTSSLDRNCNASSWLSSISGKSCLLNWKNPDELVEGDWIAKAIKVKGKIIASPKDLGLENKQINLMRKLKVKKILVKDGLPFIPAFLLGYILTVLFGAWFFF